MAEQAGQVLRDRVLHSPAVHHIDQVAVDPDHIDQAVAGLAHIVQEVVLDHTAVRTGLEVDPDCIGPGAVHKAHSAVGKASDPEVDSLAAAAVGPSLLVDSLVALVEGLRSLVVRMVVAVADILLVAAGKASLYDVNKFDATSFQLQGILTSLRRRRTLVVTLIIVRHLAIPLGVIV